MIISRIVKRLGYIAASVILFLALVLSILRLSIPYLNAHLPDFETWATRVLNVPVSIGDVYVSWHVYEPVLTFNQVKFLNKTNRKPQFQIDTAKLNFNLLGSLLERKLLLESITISGAHLTVHQETSGGLSIEGLSGLQVTDNLVGGSARVSEMAGWFLSLPKLNLQNVDLRFLPEKGQALEFTVNKFNLDNSGDTHKLSGRIVLKQKIPTKLNFDVKLKGDLTNLANVSAESFIYLEGVSLQQWLGGKTWNNLQIMQGLGSLKIWIDWDKNTLQKIQSKMQFYDLEIMSSLTKKIQAIPRFSAHLGWRRESEKQIIAGDQIFLDLPEHLWPVTAFFVKLTPKQNGVMFPEEININYFDLGDVKRYAINSGLVSTDIQKKLLAFNPEGEFSQFKLKLSPESTNQNDLLSSIATHFDHVSVHAQNPYPGIGNLSGSLEWNGKEGALDLDSHHMTVTYGSVFENDLMFDQLSGQAHLQQETNHYWLMQVNHLAVQSADVNLDGNVAITFPPNESPQTNIAATFQITNAEHIARYLPQKILDSDLNQWLKHAFSDGQVTAGKISVQGRLSDFPFDNKAGKFIVSGNIQDVSLHYAPGWPLIQHINGNLTFSGRSMSVDVHSGQTLDVPLNSIHAVIPYLGDAQPIILNVQGDIKSDLSDALEFIHASPLEQKFGKSLEHMNLSGAMKLGLNLSIPLKTPENTKVIGDVTIPNANMELPQWKINLEQLQGTFHFTDTDILANDLHAKWFGEEATLNISTQHPANKPPFVLANLKSQFDLSTLQIWLHVPLAPTAKGKTDFNAELHLYGDQKPAQANEVAIRTDLRGVEINLPMPYGKKPDDVRHLQINLFSSSQLLQAKINYSQLLTAALQFEQTPQGMQFLNGEVSLGGEASWQKERGLLLSGKFKELDWETIQKQFSSKSTMDSSLLRGINLNIDSFTIYGQHLKEMRVQLSKIDNGWSVNVASDNMTGNLIVPMGDSKQEIQGRFQRFYLKTNSNNDSETINPQKIPALSFVGEDVRFNEIQLGRVSFSTVPLQAGLEIRSLSVESPLVHLQVDGEWRNNTTHLQGSISTTRFNELLTSWGFGSTDIVVNNGDITFDLSWRGLPYHPALASLTGNASVSMGAGRIINIGESNNAKMDIGRLLNIFSLNSIPRLFSKPSSTDEKGYDFDYIKGDFNLRNGNAFTQNAHLEGPVARIDIAGRIGLLARDFDVIVGITPYVTSSIPTVIATLTPLGPLGGLATWAVDKMLGHAMAKAISYHYSVRGPWSHPTWGQVNRSPATGGQ